MTDLHTRAGLDPHVPVGGGAGSWPLATVEREHGLLLTVCCICNRRLQVAVDGRVVGTNGGADRVSVIEPAGTAP